ncbi:MAG: thiamine pyrophosphate-dependent enzyme, partial [Pseudomonadota bacterium]
LPFDVQKAPVDADDVWGDVNFASIGNDGYGVDTSAINAIGHVLFAAKNPVIICGGGVINAGACEVLQELAEYCDLIVATTISGKGSIACVHKNCLGVVGSNGGVTETREIVATADVVLFIGCRAGSVTTQHWQVPARGQTILHIDTDPAVIGAAYQTKAWAICDAKAALQTLWHQARELPSPPAFGGAAIIERVKQRKQNLFMIHAKAQNTPIRPEAVIHALQLAAPDDAIIVADPGTPCPYVSAYFDSKQAGRHIISNRVHGALGYALGAAMGAQFARPDARVVCLMGDGSFGFTVGELETVARYHLPITMIVFSNAMFGWIKAGQHNGFAKRYFGVDFDRVNHAKVAQAYGIAAETIETPEMLEKQIKAAIARQEPVLLDIIAQPLHMANAPVSTWVA